ncbi:TPA: MucBP domain-containing protein [Streptococcus suis]
MKKNKKFVKLGIKLMASTVLVGCGVVLSTTNVFNEIVVHAETYTNTSDQPIVVVVHYHGQNLDGTTVSLTEQGEFIEFQPGQEIAAPREFEGYTLTESSYIPPAFSEGILMYTYTQNAPKQPEQPEQQSLPYTVEWYLDGQYYDGYTRNIEPGELRDRGVGDKGGIPVWSDFADVAENSPRNYKITYEKVAAGENYYRFDLVSKDKATVPYTIELVDQDGQVLRTIQQSGVEGAEVVFDFPVISGYRIGKTEGFESGTVGKNGSFRLVANKTVKVYYDKAPSIDSLIKPEQRVEYQKVFDTFHTTVLKAFEVYKKELGVDHIIRLTEDEAKFNQITQSEDLNTLQLELILVEYLFDKPVGLVLTDQDIINAIGWTPDYWDYQISYHKEITQKLEKAMANIAASKAEPTVPVDQPITIKVVYRETQIEPGQKITPFKEETFTITPSESVTLAPKTFDGWKLVVGSEQTVTYEQAKRKNLYYFEYVMDSGKTQGDNPVDIPSEQPVGEPISVTFRFVDTEGNIIHQDISWSVSNGGTPAINEAPAIDGYELVDPTQAEMLVTYEQAKENGVYIIRYTKKITPSSDNPSDSTDTPSSGDSNSSTVTPPSDSTNGSTNTPSDNSIGSTVTPPSDNSKGSTVTDPKDKEKDSTSNSNISVGGDKQPTDNKKTEQLAVDTKEKATTSATDSKKEEKSSTGTKTLPNTGQATSASEMTGFMMLGLAGLTFVIKKRRRNG